MSLKYMSTHYGYRYLTSEVAIATGLRNMPETHWNYAAENAVNRQLNYLFSAPKVNWIMTPAKVTAHLCYLEKYLTINDPVSWGSILTSKIGEINQDINIYFNPINIALLEYFFKNDSHWTAIGALTYFEPWIFANLNFNEEHKDKIKQVNSICIGNCISEEQKSNFSEEYKSLIHLDQQIEVIAKNLTIPDFSVTKTKNLSAPNQERVLIIHSSAYEFARGFFSSLFKETIEIFSPYVDSESIYRGKFDRVIIFTAERNSDVVYDGKKLSEKIMQSINQKYIQEISQTLINIRENDFINSNDVTFLKSVGMSWKVN